MPSIRRISDFKPLFTNLAQTSHYEVRFGGVGPLGGPLMAYLFRKGISQRFIAEDAGLLCFSASLPTTSLATANVSGNFMGITEKFAHTRQYIPISLEFYVDKNLNKNVVFSKRKNIYILNYNFFDQSHEIIFRSLTNLIQKLGKKYYPVRGKSINELIKRINKKSFTRVTLGGCFVERVNETILISQESSHKI